MHRSLIRLVAVAALALPMAFGSTVVAADDTDGDGVDDFSDSNPTNPFECQDSDNDGADDCSQSGFVDVCNDGPDLDGDCLADVGDPDDDNDGVVDANDVHPFDPYQCEDIDGDGADDCTFGVDQFGPLADNDPDNDGPDCDGDGIVDASDPDDDDDGVLDGDDPAPCDPDVTEELVGVWGFVHDDTNDNGVTDLLVDELLAGWGIRVYDDTGIVAFGTTGPIPPPPLSSGDIGVYLGAFPSGAELDICSGVLTGWVALSPAAGPTGESCFDATVPAGADAATYHFLVAPEVTNQPPMADAGGPYLVAADGDVALDATASSDPDGDTLTFAWAGGSFDDPSAEAPTFTAPSAAGIYEVELTVDDGTGGTATDTAIVVVYDPDGGFVTGGGWLDTPEGSCLDVTICADPSGGRANFGFVAKYTKGKTVPSGQTAFTFDTGALSFDSTSYEALIVNGSSGSAQYWGTGTIDGTGIYDFKVWTNDGDIAGGDDTFRIQIRDTDGVIVFDNGNDQPIAGGQVTVHVKKKSDG